MELNSNAHTSAKHFHPEWTRSNWLFIQFLTLEVAKWREQIQIYEMDMSSPSMLAKLPEIFDGCQERLERLLALDWLSSENWYSYFWSRIRWSFLIEKLLVIRWLNRFDKAIVRNYYLYWIGMKTSANAKRLSNGVAFFFLHSHLL